MGRRGPKAQHELTPSNGAIPIPPGDLTDAQAALWRLILPSEPAHFFDSAARLHMLRLYVEHACFRADLQALIDKTDVEVIADPEASAAFERMLRARDRETKQLVTLATKLRLTNQSRYQAKVAESAARNDVTSGMRRPWKYEGEDGEDDPFAQFDDLLAKPV